MVSTYHRSVPLCLVATPSPRPSCALRAIQSDSEVLCLPYRNRFAVRWQPLSAASDGRPDLRHHRIQHVLLPKGKAVSWIQRQSNAPFEHRLKRQTAHG